MERFVSLSIHVVYTESASFVFTLTAQLLWPVSGTSQPKEKPLGRTDAIHRETLALADLRPGALYGPQAGRNGVIAVG